MTKKWAAAIGFDDEETNERVLHSFLIPANNCNEALGKAYRISVKLFPDEDCLVNVNDCVVNDLDDVFIGDDDCIAVEY